MSDPALPKQRGIKGSGLGRPAGSKNLVPLALKQAILNTLHRVGGEDYLAQVAVDHPQVFCAMLAKILPMQVTGADGGAITIVVQTGVPASPEAE